VTAAVVVLEDNELFNAGRGAALCADGSVDFSASIMNGSNLAVGAMVGLKRARNPVVAASKLVGHAHCLLFGENADLYAEEAGAEMCEPEYFQTAKRLRQWRKFTDRTQFHLDHAADEAEEAHGTVGAVAMDRRGRFAAATSTGGMMNQLPGRVGDSPVAGAGTWANHLCAVSATGTGDTFFRLAFARRVADFVELAGMAIAPAAERALAEVATRRGRGGCIAIGPDGEIAMPHTSSHMVRGSVREGEEAHVAIRADAAETHGRAVGAVKSRSGGERKP
jgi:beta-aspartyl-peptidase (threonine type)